MENKKASVRVDVLSLAQGDARFSFPDEISAGDFDDIVEWMGLVQRKLKRMIAEPEGSRGQTGEE